MDVELGLGTSLTPVFPLIEIGLTPVLLGSEGFPTFVVLLEGLVAFGAEVMAAVRHVFTLLPTGLRPTDYEESKVCSQMT